MLRTALFVCALLSFAKPAAAVSPHHMGRRDSIFLSQVRLRLDVGAEYLAPYDDNRDIRTASINAYLCLQMFKKVHLSVGVGITAGYAWGNIIQWDKNFQNDTLETAAFGIGPGLLIRFEPIIVGRFSLSLDINEALMLYTAHFPAGGDVYNFTHRLGGAICYRITKRDKISLGGRWMHVSNGQGLNEHNPSYPAAGAAVSVIHYF